MRYYALACDYDGTLAQRGVVDEKTVSALRRLKASGRSLILVTGRELDDLQRAFPHTDLFERIVGENGAVLHRPATGEARALGAPPPRALVERLRSKRVEPLAVGQVILATRQPLEAEVLAAIQELGLEYHLIFNKGAVMILPSSLNKATGLKAALKELNLSSHNLAGVGDAENDHAFLDLCEFSAAVANALPALKEHVDCVTAAEAGAGVVELIERLLQEDTHPLAPRPGRGSIVLGTHAADQPVLLPAYGTRVLLAGTSGGGKSSFVTGFVERLIDQAYQVCVFDPEGDYPELERVVVLGDTSRVPAPEEVLKSLERPGASVVVNLMALDIEDRPRFFQRLLPQILELRARTGRPHWLVIDEAHHVLPTTWRSTAEILPPTLKGLLSVTVHPDRLSRALLEALDVAIVIGKTPAETFQELAKALPCRGPRIPPDPLEKGAAWAWWVHAEAEPVRFQRLPSRSAHRRHVRKYMQGELPPNQQFVFAGPEGKLHLRAHNLKFFLQLAEGVDDSTWLHHLGLGHYSRWFREMLKDDGLADAAAEVEKTPHLPPEESRARIRKLIEERYTASE